MKKPLLSVRDIVRITGVTARTLRYYDRIHLFKPTLLTEAGYRLYDRSSLEKLQTILFFKEIGFSLKEIADIVTLPKQEQKQLLVKHSQTLRSKKERLETILLALEEYVSGKDISQLPIFNHSSVLPLQEQYANEANFIYAETEGYKEFLRNTDKLTGVEKKKLFTEFEQSMQDIFRRMAACMGDLPSSGKAQQLVVEWKKLMEQFMTCDAELLACLANTYKYDTRFKGYINQYSQGDLAEFLYLAIMHYIKQHQFNAKQ